MLQVGAVTALEEPADPSPFNLDPQQTWFNFTAPNALATFSLTRQ